MDMVYMKLYWDDLDLMEALSDAERGRLLTAALKYGRSGETVSLSGNERILIPALRMRIDRDRAALQAEESEAHERRVQAGRKGGVAKASNASNASKSKQTLANPSKPSINNNTNTNTNTNNEEQIPKTNTGDTGADAPKRPRAFVPPTPSAVREYCLQKGYAIDPEAFVDYYAKQGWKLSNGLPIRDWQACVRTWARRDQERGVQARPQSSGNAFADLVREGVFEDDDASVAF